MSTRSPGLDEAVQELSAGARQWIRLHAGYLGSPAAHAELPVTPHVKALLQLALLCRFWGKTEPGDAGLGEPTAALERAWQHPDFPCFDILDPVYARPLQLMYAALAPADTDARRSALARLAADGYLTPHRKSPYLRLETRFFADLAGGRHRLESYQELYASSVLARAAVLPVADLDVCNITHTIFYLGDFGFRDPGLTEEAREQARRIVDRLTDLCVRRGDWDLIGKLVLGQYCLGLDPLRTESGAAAIRMLARAQSPDGAIPGRSAADRATAATTHLEFFRMAYQVTLTTALATLIITSGRPVALSAVGASEGWGSR